MKKLLSTENDCKFDKNRLKSVESVTKTFLLTFYWHNVCTAPFTHTKFIT